MQLGNAPAVAQRAGRIALIGGGIVAGVGLLAWLLGKRYARGAQQQLVGSSTLGDTQVALPGRGSSVPVVNTVTRGGMVLKHRKKGILPIKERVGIIQDLVWEGVQDPQMRELALAITGNGVRSVTVGKYTFKVQGASCPARDGTCEARAVYNWVRQNVRYTGDVAPVKQGRNGPLEPVDLFQSAKRTIEFGGGDCDDADLLEVAILGTLTSLNGVTTRVRWAQESKHLRHRVTAPKALGDWGHIYPVIGTPKTNPTKWIAIDATLPGSRFGVEVPHARRQDFPA